MTRKRGRLAGVLITTLSATVAIALEGAPVSQELSQPDIPQPKVRGLPAPARQRIESVQQALVAMLGEGEDSPQRLSEGIAFLGQLYHAYDLLDAAESSYTSALRREPGNGDWLYLRGLVRLARGDLAASAEDFRAAAHRREGLAAARIRLGEALLELGRLEEAQAAFVEVRDRSGPSAAAEYGLGRVALASGNAAEAVKHFQAALSLQPSGLVVHEPLARAYNQLGETAKAQRHLGQLGDGAIEYPDPLSDGIHRIRTVTAFDTVREMAASQESFEENTFLRFVLTRLGGTSGAILQLRSILAKLESSGESAALVRGRLHYAVGGLLLQQDRIEEAIAELSSAVELVPELRDARLLLGNCLARLGRFEEAAGQYDGLLTLEPDHAVALTKRAAVRANLGRIAEARADFERAIAVASDSRTLTAARNLLASLEMDAGRPAAAMAQYRQVLQADPKNFTALAAVAALLGREGRYLESASTYHELVASDPRNAAARVGEAVALILAKQYAAARDRLSEGVEALPQSQDLKARLTRLLAASPDHSVRDGQLAVTLAKELFASNPTAETVETLAMAYAEAADFSKALLWQRRLLGAEEVSVEPEERARWQRNLTRYEAGRSCCDWDDDNDYRRR